MLKTHFTRQRVHRVQTRPTSRTFDSLFSIPALHSLTIESTYLLSCTSILLLPLEQQCLLQRNVGRRETRKRQRHCALTDQPTRTEALRMAERRLRTHRRTHKQHLELLAKTLPLHRRSFSDHFLSMADWRLLPMATMQWI